MEPGMALRDAKQCLQTVLTSVRGQALPPAVAEAVAARRKELKDEKSRGRTGRRGKDSAAAAAADPGASQSALSDLAEAETADIS